MPTNSTWFQRNQKLILTIIGVLMIIGAACLFVFVPAPAKESAASGQGFSLPFSIVLLVIGALIVPSPVHAIMKAYLVSKAEKAAVPKNGP